MPRQKTGGRKKGTPNKVTAEIMQYTRQYTEDAVNALVTVMRNPDSPPQARVSAANALLDRAYGKPSQHVLNETVDDSPVNNIDFEALSDDQLAILAGLPTKQPTDSAGETGTSQTTRRRVRSVSEA